MAIDVPLVEGDDGGLRVAETRVSLDVIAAAYDAGASAEEIAHAYPTLGLPAVYAVLAWMVSNDAELRAYLGTRAERVERVRNDAEARFPQAGLRARLMGRRST